MPEDRDPLFEQALARHFRSDGARESWCLDPETLAAYHARVLSPEEVSSAKSHIVSCARCQEILAHLEATSEVNELIDVAQQSPALVAGLKAKQVSGARDRVVLLAASAAPAGANTKAGAKKSVAIPHRKYFSLRWVAPAGAIAASLLLWIGLREARIDIKPARPVSQVAENRQQQPRGSDAGPLKESTSPKEPQKQKSPSASPGSADDLERQAAAAPAMVLRDEKKDSAVGEKLESESNRPSVRHEYSARAGTGMAGGRGPSAAAAQAQANNALQRSDQGVAEGAAGMVDASPAPPDLDKGELRKAAPRAKAGTVAGLPLAPSPLPASKRLPGRLRGTVTDPSGAVVAGANVVLKSASGGTVAATSTDTTGTYSFSGVAEGNYQLQLESSGFRTDILTGLNIQPGENVLNAKLQISSSTESVEVAAQPPLIHSQEAELSAPPVMGRHDQALDLASFGLQTVASPDGTAVWKVGEAGQILHSRNAGRDWTSEASGVTVKLFAGSAPSAKVCWVAGASGTLLRTTDGGKRWQRIPAPIRGDLGGVHASDAKHASIWDASNRSSYKTSDGGATWQRSANE